MAGIRTVNTFEVEADIGKCFIELCVGDITALPKNEGVDVLVLSAFPGDYSPTPSSLIGQLLLKLCVNVSQLAKDKEEDLRKLYSCWWSKPLPDHLSFRKILCFEGGGKLGKTVGQVVGDVFRCLVPILANNEGKVIMPILASGDQRHSKTKMLRLLVNAAIHWMTAGLPLRSLKIVIFSRDIKKISNADQPLLDLFRKIKDNHKQEGKIDKDRDEVKSYTYDVYLSYSEDDKKCVSHIVDILVEKKTDIRIFSAIQQLDLETSWQSHVYDVIKKCKRVLVLITPSFLQSTRCTEQYNIALCHSRKTHERVLMPLYVSEVSYMPTYMRITQYIDCRVSFQETLNAACITVIGCLSCKPLDVTTEDNEKASVEQKSSEQKYDIFLSYCHRNVEHAKQIMEELRIKKPDLRVFIDTAELEAGGAWQLTLYSALQRSKSVIALISNDYLRSKVCIEELSLSIALQLQKICKIWPLVIEPLQETIEWLDMLSPVSCYNETEEKYTSIFFACDPILDALEDDPGNARLTENKLETLSSCLKEARLFFLEKEFLTMVVDTPIDGGVNNKVPALLPKDTSCAVDIYIICSSEDMDHCSLLQKIISFKMKSLIVKISIDEDASTCLTYLDKARLVIPLLSSSFTQSPDLVHELNIAWCRQRDSSHLCFLAIGLDELSRSQTYISLFPCFFNREDFVEIKQSEILKMFSGDDVTSIYQGCNCPLNDLLCLMTVVHHMEKWFDGEPCPVLGVHNKLFNCLKLGKCIKQCKETKS